MATSLEKMLLLVEQVGLKRVYESEALKDFKVEPLVFSSNNRQVDLEKQATYSFKLFVFNNYGAEAELFATVDTYKKALMITEKDAIYRKNLLSAFIDE